MHADNGLRKHAYKRVNLIKLHLKNIIIHLYNYLAGQRG